MGLRTTSVSESMHSSMKSGFDAARASMNTDLSANTMVDKSERRLHDRKRENAKQEKTSKKWSELPVAALITKYCLQQTEAQWDFSATKIYQTPHSPADKPTIPLVLLRLAVSNEVSVSTYVLSDTTLLHVHVRSTVELGLSASLRQGRRQWVDGDVDGRMAEEFSRNSEAKECICVNDMSFLSEDLDSWLSIQDNENPKVMGAKLLYELTWVQGKVAVKGIPPPDIDSGKEPDEGGGTFCLECHVPEIIRNIQLSQQNAITSYRQEKEEEKESRQEMNRDCERIASGSRDLERTLRPC
ncbi:hypothetical protein IV203_020737 [Nitzschia inconspicua]|uniref:Uncharacterized protein n=1 Tax=Nitzschia inconspicua TaxID=303405 RepID=A0A9K3PB57_9STRA|nr:hypothetical protein IV203_021571 [Nitzschia inconspicua]KAG7342793.1 hypothetical protein IV203_020737 [Nitzschia inconspicua]